MRRISRERRHSMKDSEDSAISRSLSQKLVVSPVGSIRRASMSRARTESQDETSPGVRRPPSSRVSRNEDNMHGEKNGERIVGIGGGGSSGSLEARRSSISNASDSGRRLSMGRRMSRTSTEDSLTRADSGPREGEDEPRRRSSSRQSFEDQTPRRPDPTRAHPYRPSA